MFVRMLNWVINLFSADDKASERYDAMDEIEKAIAKDDVVMVKYLIEQSPGLAHPGQKAWLEQKLQEKGDQK